MPHPKDSELLPIGSRVIWTRPSHRLKPSEKVVEAVVVGHFKMNGNFLHYEVLYDGKTYAGYHDDLKLKV
jgi:hypothetical protein